MDSDPSSGWPTARRLRRVWSLPQEHRAPELEKGGATGWTPSDPQEVQAGVWSPESEAGEDWGLKLLGPGEERGWGLDSYTFGGQYAGPEPRVLKEVGLRV